MNRRFNHHDDSDEYLHPLWLGILLLFIVMIMIGISCYIRKNFGSSIYNVFNRLCCKQTNDEEHNVKTTKPLSTIYNYNWAPIFIPSTSASPKLHSLVRSIQMASLEKSLSASQMNSQESMNAEQDPLTPMDECDHTQTFSLPHHPESNPQPSNSHDCETARKFYASMRHISQLKNSNSVDSSQNEPISLPITNLIKPNQANKIKAFRTPRFFHSITDRNY